MAEEITPEDKAAAEKKAKRMKELTTVSTEEAQKSLEDDGIDIDAMVEKYEWSSREDFIEKARKGMETQMKSLYQTPSQAKQFRAYMKRSMKSKKMTKANKNRVLVKKEKKMAISELKKKLSEFFKKGYYYFPVDSSDSGEYGTDFHDHCSDEGLNPWDAESPEAFLISLYDWIEYISQYDDFFKENEKIVTFVDHDGAVGYIVFGKLDDWDFISVDISKENYDEFDSLELAINEFHDN